MTETRPAMTAEEIGKRGEALYSAGIRAQVEDANRGKFLVLNVFTGEYEIDADEAKAYTRALSRRPNDLFYIIRVGYRVAHRLGAGLSMGNDV